MGHYGEIRGHRDVEYRSLELQNPDLSSRVGDGRPSSAACEDLYGFISLLEAHSAALGLVDLYLYTVDGVDVVQVFVRWGRRPVGVTYLAQGDVTALCTLAGRGRGGPPAGLLKNPFTGRQVGYGDVAPCPLPLEGCRLVEVEGALMALARMTCVEVYSVGLQFLVACRHMLRWSMEGVDVSADFERDVARTLTAIG